MKEFDLNGIGRVTFIKNRRAKKLNISLDPAKELRVSVPHYVSFRDARKVILANLNWVRRYLVKMERAYREHELFFRDKPLLTRSEYVKKLDRRLKDLSFRFGFTYNKVSFRDQRTLWGSCSAQGNISLNVKLARLPEKLIDYVILHELVHTSVKNHGKIFWSAMDAVIENARGLDKELRKYSPALL